MYSLIISIVQFNQIAETCHVNECLAILAESGSETTSEALKIQNIDTSISATNGLSTSYLLPTPLCTDSGVVTVTTHFGRINCALTGLV